ncbi:MAG TPA: hypothetical protein VHZ76_07640 [Gammaproteobacteria bacterium]|jgi:hypothetical protein|nr:hypothetical protein [Gammaproteobacteria bacterium]
MADKAEVMLEVHRGTAASTKSSEILSREDVLERLNEAFDAIGTRSVDIPEINSLLNALVAHDKKYINENYGKAELPPLFYAAEIDDPNLAHWLVERGADVNATIEIKKANGETDKVTLQQVVANNSTMRQLNEQLSAENITEKDQERLLAIKERIKKRFNAALIKPSMPLASNEKKEESDREKPVQISTPHTELSEISTQERETQFWQAMKNKDVTAVIHLLKTYPKLIDSKENGLYPLHFAASIDHIEMMQGILSSVSEDKKLEILNKKDNEGYIPLDWVIISDHAKRDQMIELLESNTQNNETKSTESELIGQIKPAKKNKILTVDADAVIVEPVSITQQSKPVNPDKKDDKPNVLKIASVSAPSILHQSSTADVIVGIKKDNIAHPRDIVGDNNAIRIGPYSIDVDRRKDLSVETKETVSYLQQLHKKVFDKKLSSKGINPFSFNDGVVDIREKLKELHPNSSDKDVERVLKDIQAILNKKSSDNKILRSKERQFFYKSENIVINQFIQNTKELSLLKQSRSDSEVKNKNEDERGEKKENKSDRNNRI